MTVLKPGEKLIAFEKDVKAGPLAINDAFDLYFVETQTGHYKLIVFMKIQFFFEEGNGGKWQAQEKTQFINQWKSSIKSMWGGRLLKTLKESKKRISIEFRFETQIDGFMFDHWEITVEKVKSFARSYVNPRTGNVKLDSLDLKLTRKHANHSQKGADHEFGHMLGLEDEYLDGNPHNKDYRSIMNSGSTILLRHNAPYMKWLNNTLKEQGIQ